MQGGSTTIVNNYGGGGAYPHMHGGGVLMGCGVCYGHCSCVGGGGIVGGIIGMVRASRPSVLHSCLAVACHFPPPIICLAMVGHLCLC